MNLHWTYFDGKTLEQKVVLSDIEAQNIGVVSITFKRYPEFLNTTDKDLAQIRPKRDPSLIDPHSIQGQWNALALPTQELVNGGVFTKYEGLKQEDANYFKSISDLLQYSINPLHNETLPFVYLPNRRVMDFIRKPKK